MGVLPWPVQIVRPVTLAVNIRLDTLTITDSTSRNVSTVELAIRMRKIAMTSKVKWDD